MRAQVRKLSQCPLRLASRSHDLFSCSYDKLIVDEHVFIFNDQEKRVERLPYTVSGALAPPVIKVFTVGEAVRSTCPLGNEEGGRDDSPNF